MGLLNPIFDRQIVTQIGTLAVSGGVVSMLTLVMKGVFCLLASFLLMATTTIEEICRALRQLHLPKTITSLLLLTFRYIGVLLSEVSVMQEAYSLRAPGQKGVHISAWGSFLGQLLLRSMDRAEALYESMELRGYHGEFHYAQGRPSSRASWPFAIGCAALIVLAGMVLMLLPTGGSKADSGGDSSEAAESFSLEETEKRMAEVLGTINGVGRVRIMLTRRSGSTLRLAEASTSSDSRIWRAV